MFSTASQYNDNVNYVTYDEMDEIGRLEAPATQAYEKLMTAWRRGVNGQKQYPVSYGGCYLNRDTYKLVIKLVNGDTLLRSHILNIVGNSKAIEFVSTDVSLNGLYRAQAICKALLSQFPILGLSISQRKSLVNIRVPSAQMASASRLIMNCEDLGSSRQHILINECVGFIPYAITYNPGRVLYGAGGMTNRFGTVGWYGTGYFAGSYKTCMLTAGHVARSMATQQLPIYFGTTKVFDSALWNNPSYASIYYPVPTAGVSQTTVGDYAMVVCSDITLTTHAQMSASETWNVNGSLTNVEDLMENKTVYKAMGVSGMTRGTVLDTYSELPNAGDYLNITTTGVVTLTSDTTFAVPGDSGAPILTKDSNNNTIICGVFNGQETGRAIYGFTPLTLINQHSYFAPHIA